MWARFAAYAAIGFGAACLWVLLGGSPASAAGADDAQPGLLDSVGTLTTQATQSVTDLTRGTLDEVGKTGQQVTGTVRDVAAQTGVQPVEDLVDHTTGTVDQVVDQTVKSGNETVQQVAQTVDETVAQPVVDEPRHTTPDAGLVKQPQQLRTEAPAASPTPAASAAPVRPHPPVESAQVPNTTREVSAPAAAYVPHAGQVERQSAPDLGTSPDRAPEGTGPTAGSAAAAAAALPGTDVVVPRTAAVVGFDAVQQAPRPPTFSPGFAPD